MRKLLVLLAACGSNHSSPDATIIVKDAPSDATVIDGKTVDASPDAPPDAPQFDFSCLGQPIPDTADATVTISGTARVVGLMGMSPTITPLAGASIEACKAGAANCTSTNRVIGPVTSDSMGAFTLGPITTNGTPVAAFLRLTATGDRTIEVFPPYPAVTDMANVPAVTFDNGVLALLGLVGITQSPTNGMLGLFVTDCANTPLTGVTISATQGGTAVGQIFDASALSSMAAGGYFVFDVPPGDTTVTATFDGMEFRTSPVQVIPSIAGVTTETQVRPGP